MARELLPLTEEDLRQAFKMFLNACRIDNPPVALAITFRDGITATFQHPKPDEPDEPPTKPRKK
jgi:hypothetical protein